MEVVRGVVWESRYNKATVKPRGRARTVRVLPLQRRAELGPREVRQVGRRAAPLVDDAGDGRRRLARVVLPVEHLQRRVMESF